MLTVFFRVVGLLPLAIGLFLCQHAGKNIIEAYRATTWPSVPGRIISARIGSPYEGAPGSVKRSDAVMARVEYGYAVNGIDYTATRVSLNAYGSSFRKPQQEIVDRYAQGSEVRVFYDPEKPSRSILEARMPIGPFLILAGGGIFLLIGFFFILQAPRIFGKPKIRSQA